MKALGRTLAALALLAQPGCAELPTPALGPQDVRTTSKAEVPRGTLMNFGFTFEVRKDATLTLLSVDLLDPTPGLEVVDIWGFRPSEAGEVSIGAFPGDLPRTYPGYVRRYPLDEVTLTATRPTEWQVIVTVRASEVGTYASEGLRVHYRNDGSEEQAEIAFGVELLAIDCSRDEPPDSCIPPENPFELRPEDRAPPS